MSQKEKRPYISDPKLLPRIKAYLQTQHPDTFISPDDLSQHLRTSYGDYARRPKKVFIQLVSKVLPVARVEVFGPDANLKGTKRHRKASSSESDSDDLVAYENTNSLNLAMRNLYKNNGSAKTPPPSQTPGKQKSKKTPHGQRTPSSSVRDSENPATPVRWVVDRCGSGDASRNKEDMAMELASDQAVCPVHASDSAGVEDTVTSTAVCTSSTSSETYEKSNVADKAKLSVDKEDSVPSRSKKREKSGAVRTTSVMNGMEDGEQLGESPKKKIKRKKTKLPEPEASTPELEPTFPATTFNDFGGNTKLLKELYWELDEFFYSDFCRSVGKTSCRGYLLQGPKGSGKKFLAECIAGHMKLPLLKPRVNSLISGLSGDSEQRIRDLFEQTATHAPCVLYLEDVECLAPRQENPGASKDMMTRIISELGSCIDELHTRPENVLLLAATSNIDSIHKDLRIPGRFIEKALGMPDEKSRESILEKLCSKYTISADFSLKTLARLTPGFVGGDLHELTNDALSTACRRVRDIYRATEAPTDEFPEFSHPPAHLSGTEIQPSEQDLKAMILTEEDFMAALAKAQPAAKREGFATVPTTTWADVGALHDVRAQLEDSILLRIRDPETAAAYGLPTNSGTILVGPPGCGKTLVAKAMANEAGLNFMYIKGPELLDKYVGESERKLRQKFEKAQLCAPCLIFFDEMDTLCSNRQGNEGSNVNKSVTNQLLALMDGCGERNQVYVMGATNIIENVDPALQRPGRFDRKIFIGLPDADGRLDILKAITQSGTKRKLVSCDLQQCAQETEGFSGADLKHLMDEASTIAWKENIKDERWRGCEKDQREYVVSGEHIAHALQLVKPSVMKKDVEKYRKVALQM